MYSRAPRAAPRRRHRRSRGRARPFRRPATRPPWSRLLVPARRLCSAVGSCSSCYPNKFAGAHVWPGLDVAAALPHERLAPVVGGQRGQESPALLVCVHSAGRCPSLSGFVENTGIGELGFPPVEMLDSFALDQYT